MRTEREIKDNLSHIEYHHSLISDLYQKGKYDGLKWVLEDDEYSEPKINREKEALEKQIPKKINSDNGFGGRCPVCGYYVAKIIYSSKGYKYCPECGQAIDWEVKE